MKLRGFICALTVALLFCACSGGRGGAYPNRLIELIVPWAPGGGTDRVARFIAEELQKRLGQPVVVVNRTGGSGAVGHSAGALAPADGYTITMATFELSTMRSMGISQLTWQDFTPVAQVNADAAAVFVKKDAPWKTLPELLEAIRAAPKKFKMSGTATGGAWDLARSGLLLAAKIRPDDVIWSPTQGAAPALVELLGGHVDAVCCSVPEATSQLDAGQIRALAVTGPARLPEYPDIPTAREQGIDYEAVGWRGIMLPKNASADVSDKLATALREITGGDAFKAFMKKNGFAIEVKTTADFAQFLAAQEIKWNTVIKSAGYQTLGKNNDPGPFHLPKVLLGLLGITVVAETIRSRKEESKIENPNSKITGNPLLLLVALLIYLFLLPRLGFNITTFIFSTLMMWRLGSRIWAALLSSGILVAAIYALFTILFKVRLP